MFTHFYPSFCYLETAFDTYKAGETEAIVKPNGDRVYTGRTETYARHLSGALLNTVLGLDFSQKIFSIAIPLHEDFFKHAVAEFKKLQPSEEEFLLVITLLLWSAGLVFGNCNGFRNR